MKEFWDTVLPEQLTIMGTRIVHFLPNLFAAVIILGIGWPLAWALGRGVEHLLRMMGVDHFAEQFGINAFLTRGGLKPDPSYLAGRTLYWGLLVLTTLHHSARWTLRFSTSLPQAFCSISRTSSPQPSSWLSGYS